MGFFHEKIKIDKLYYYKHKFISPESIFAEVREELRSYLDTGMVDDSMFPIWTNQCLQKLGKSTFPVKDSPPLIIADFETRLPDDFYSEREVWMCTNFESSIQHPSAVYTYTSTRLDTPDLYCNRCVECEHPDIITAIYKTTNTVAFKFSISHLLKPGNVKKRHDGLHCDNHNFDFNLNHCKDTYEIHNNKLVTNFREGTIYLVYYSSETDCDDNQLIPDSYRIKEFIKAFLKQKLFEQIFNQTTDESFNQSLKKYEFYKQLSDEAYIIADTEEKKETIYQKAQKIRKTLTRNHKFDIR